MSDSKEKLRTTANKLRTQIADCEATLGGLKNRLAKIEAQVEGKPVVMSALDEIWKLAPASSRANCSKHSCRKRWNLIPKNQRPTAEVLIHAMKVWSRCPQWKKDGGQYAPAVDRWIEERRWEDLPEVAEAPSRARQAAPKVIPQTPPEEAATAADIAAAFAPLKPRRMNS